MNVHIMKQNLLCIGLLSVSIIAFSQPTFLHDNITGKPYMLLKYSKVVDGSAFFRENLMHGNVIMQDGQEFKNLRLRLNLLENELNYLNQLREEMISTGPVKELILFDSLTGLQHTFNHTAYLNVKDISVKGWLENLEKGKVSLFKQYYKNLMETFVYNSPNADIVITTQIRYYILYNDQWLLIKRIKNISDILSSKKDELTKFINENKLKADNEENFKSIISYFNNLQ